jgi:hypothetical protein
MTQPINSSKVLTSLPSILSLESTFSYIVNHPFSAGPIRDFIWSLFCFFCFSPKLPISSGSFFSLNSEGS